MEENLIISERICAFCPKPLTKFQRRFCSQSCHFRHLNDSRTKWTTEITAELHDILEGVLLSDGNLELSKTSRYPRFTIGQSAAHLDYLEFLCDKLNLERDRITPRTKYNAQSNKTFKSFVLATKTSPIWTSYYQRWYPKGIKVIPKDFKVTRNSLLHTYLGDGSLGRYIANKKYGGQTYYKVILYLMNFSESDLKEILLPQFENLNMPFNFRIGKQTGYSRGYPIITIEKNDSLKRFFEFVGTNPVPCYNYKFDCIDNL